MNTTMYLYFLAGNKKALCIYLKVWNQMRWLEMSALIRIYDVWDWILEINYRIYPKYLDTLTLPYLSFTEQVHFNYLFKMC